MRQSREFATAFAANVERSPKKKEAIVEMITDARAGVLYAKGSREFAEGLDKIPQDLLDLLKSQFASEPDALIRGAMRFTDVEEEKETSSEMQEENINDFDEEDSE